MNSNKDLDELINNHLNTQSFHDIKVVERTANLFIAFEEQFVSSVNGETFYTLPYKDITVNIFNSSVEEIHTNTFQGFCTTVSEVLVELCNGTPSGSNLTECYEKFTHHIALALIQKQFILKSAKEANEIAGSARNIANMAREVANNAKTASGTAQILAAKAEKLANDAEDQAKSTIANYIAILGIFASIIFTLFGGVNVISATVKLLEANSRWPYLTFIIALLMICLLTLLNMLIKWITTINNLKNELDRVDKTPKAVGSENNKSSNKLQKIANLDFYTKSIMLFSVVLFISLIGMYKVNKENNFSFSTETTTKNLLIEDTAPSKEGNTGKKVKENPNIEKTIVERFIVSKGNSQELAKQED